MPCGNGQPPPFALSMPRALSSVDALVSSITPCGASGSPRRAWLAAAAVSGPYSNEVGGEAGLWHLSSRRQGGRSSAGELVMGSVLRALYEDIVAQFPTYGSAWFRRWKFLYNIAAFSGVHAPPVPTPHLHESGKEFRCFRM